MVRTFPLFPDNADSLEVIEPKKSEINTNPSVAVLQKVLACPIMIYKISLHLFLHLPLNSV